MLAMYTIKAVRVNNIYTTSLQINSNGRNTPLDGLETVVKRQFEVKWANPHTKMFKPSKSRKTVKQVKQ